MSSFQDLGGVRTDFLCLVIKRSIRVTPLGLCFRVIVNERPLNLEKTTSTVLSVLLLIDAISKLGFHPHIKCFHYAGGGCRGGSPVGFLSEIHCQTFCQV